MLSTLTRTVRKIINRFRLVSGESLESLSDEDWFRETESGVYVSERTAYTYGPWFRAISLISSCVAKTNLDLWREENGKWVKAKSHPAWRLLCGHGKPNEETLRYHFFQTLTAHAAGHGGGFAYIVRNKIGEPIELLQLRPDRTFPIRENGQLLFVTSIGGDYGATGAETRKLLAENVLHIHGLGFDGLTGYSLLDLAARSLGSAIAKEKFGAKFFSNSATPGVVITSPRKLSDDAMKNLKDSWQSLRTGLDQSHKPIILEDEASIDTFTHNASDSQLVESMMWDPVVVSNFTGVPAFMLGAKGYNSNSTLETQSQNLLDFTIDPWFVPWEQECSDKLLTEREKLEEKTWFEFLRKDLIRVDSDKRAASNRAALGGHPWAKVSEIRDDEGLDREADTDFIPKPLNMGGASAGADPTIEDLAAQLDELKTKLEAKSKRRRKRIGGHKPALVKIDEQSDQREAVRQLWTDTAGRMARRLSTAAARRSGVDEAALVQEHGPVIRSAFEPLLKLTAGTHANTDELARGLCRDIANGQSPDSVAAAVVAKVCNES